MSERNQLGMRQSPGIETMRSVHDICSEALRPEHFYLASGLAFASEQLAVEDDLWEVFQGRLLDRPVSRKHQTFAAWNLYLVEHGTRSGEPLLSLKLDECAGQLHIVRGVETYAHEAYDAGGGVLQTRERRRWLRELTGTLHLQEFSDPGELGDELAARLFRAVVGASRLPLHSVEAPLPAFSFGLLFYRYRRGAPSDVGPLRTITDLVNAMTEGWTAIECAKMLETCLHSPLVSETADLFATHWSRLGRAGSDLIRLLKTLFNEVSLSPWTGLAERTLAYLAEWENRGVLQEDQVTDFLAHLLRQTGRHLTAYDLIIFHHRGANYPDALLLDAVLKAYLGRINDNAKTFQPTIGDDAVTARRKRLRRRALRQGWLLRRQYEGHPVPDAPVSPGEHARVYPAEYLRVPEEQILQSAKRKKRLFADDDLTTNLGEKARQVLKESVTDLDDSLEVRELGVALYLDRPFGDAKAPVEPDATTLLASEAFSASIATGRLAALQRDGLLQSDESARLASRLRAVDFVTGLALETIGQPPRPGTIALTDARMASGDFLFLRTVPGSVLAILDQFEFTALVERMDMGWLTEKELVLVARSPNGNIALYDSTLRQRVELAIAPGGYKSRRGVEYPANGLRVVRAWESGDQGYTEVNLHLENPLLKPRE